MQRRVTTAMRFDFGDMAGRGSGRGGLRLATTSGIRGPQKYGLLDLKRRRAQIRARRELGLT